MLASHRKINEVQAYEIELDDDSELKQKSIFQLLSTHVGHSTNLGSTLMDVKNYLTARRQRSMVYGEVGCLSSMHTKWILTYELQMSFGPIQRWY